MAMVSTHGMTANSTRVGGKMENNMAKASTEKMEKIEEVFGKTGRESNGWMIRQKMFKTDKVKMQKVSIIPINNNYNIIN